MGIGVYLRELFAHSLKTWRSAEALSGFVYGLITLVLVVFGIGAAGWLDSPVAVALIRLAAVSWIVLLFFGIAPYRVWKRKTAVLLGVEAELAALRMPKLNIDVLEMQWVEPDPRFPALAPGAFIKLEVRCTRGQVAKNCRANLIWIKKMSESGQLIELPYHDRSSLFWPHHGPDVMSAIDITPNVPGVLDVVCYRLAAGHIAITHRPTLNTMSLFADPGTYQLGVNITGDDIDHLAVIELVWDGTPRSLGAKKLSA